MKMKFQISQWRLQSNCNKYYIWFLGPGIKRLHIQRNMGISVYHSAKKKLLRGVLHTSSFQDYNCYIRQTKTSTILMAKAFCIRQPVECTTLYPPQFYVSKTKRRERIPVIIVHYILWNGQPILIFVQKFVDLCTGLQRQIFC